MDEERLDRLVYNLYFFFPLFRKKLFRFDKIFKQKRMPHSYYHVLRVLNKGGTLPISKIGRRVYIHKSNMTFLIDKLVEKGLAERLPDKKDRRIINIAITDEGKDLLMDWRKNKNKEIKEKLSTLSEADLEKLYESSEIIRNILQKMGND